MENMCGAMTTVIPGLLVASLDEAFDADILQTSKVGCVLNVASELEFASCGRLGMEYHKVTAL